MDHQILSVTETTNPLQPISHLFLIFLTIHLLDSVEHSCSAGLAGLTFLNFFFRTEILVNQAGGPEGQM